MIKMVKIEKDKLLINSEKGEVIKKFSEYIIFVEIQGIDGVIIHTKGNKEIIKSYCLKEDGTVLWEDEHIINTRYFIPDIKSFGIQSLMFQGSMVWIELEEGIYTRDFGDEIRSFSTFSNNRILIRLNMMNKIGNRNIFCLNQKAEILWQIQDPDTYRPGLPKSESPFTGIEITNEGKLKVWNWNDGLFYADINTGKLKYIDFVK